MVRNGMTKILNMLMNSERLASKLSEMRYLQLTAINVPAVVKLSKNFFLLIMLMAVVEKIERRLGGLKPFTTGSVDMDSLRMSSGCFSLTVIFPFECVDIV